MLRRHQSIILPTKSLYKTTTTSTTTRNCNHHLFVLAHSPSPAQSFRTVKLFSPLSLCDHRQRSEITTSAKTLSNNNSNAYHSKALNQKHIELIGNSKSTNPPTPSVPPPPKTPTFLGIPKPALTLSVFGLIPIAAPHCTPDFLMNAYMETIVNAQITFAIVLLPFLGAVHWGLAMARYRRGDGSSGENRTRTHDWFQYTVSGVLPLVVSWAALNTDDQSTAVWLLMGGFSLVLMLDLFVWSIRLTPLWYPVIRIPLTLLVVACLYFTYARFTKEKLIVTADVPLFNVEEVSTAVARSSSAPTKKEAVPDELLVEEESKPVITVEVKKPSEHPKTTLFVHGEIPEEKDEYEDILRSDTEEE